MDNDNIVENGIESEEEKHENMVEEESEELVPDTSTNAGPRKPNIFLVIAVLLLLAIPSAYVILQFIGNRNDQILRSEMTSYLVFSYELHLRSYWAMTNIDYAFEAGSNDGDYGKTTMYFPLYVKRAWRQVSLAQEEISSYRGEIPSEASISYRRLCNCFDELEELSDDLRSIPSRVVPYGEFVADSIITTWTGREAVRSRFDFLKGNLREIRMDAVVYGYDWVYEDMRLKAFYDIQLDPGQTMFSSNSF